MNYDNLYGVENDERYTPKCLVDIIVPFIDPSLVVWCPFDMENSEFVLCFKENGNKVIHSHILDAGGGGDFLKYTPKERFDVIVSNPPFSIKLDVFKKLFELGKPFAMVMSMMALNNYSLCDLFMENEIQILVPDKRITYDGKTCSFISGYFCKGILPKQLMFVKTENNTGKRFVPSRMTLNVKEIKEQLEMDI